MTTASINPTPTSPRGFGSLFARATQAAANVFLDQPAPSAAPLLNTLPNVRLSVMLANGTRAGTIFGGTFGVVVDGKFNVDEDLKGIYLLRQIDGLPIGNALSDEDQSARDTFIAMGGTPEIVTFDVPGDLVAPLKATLIREASDGWQSMYADLTQGMQRTNGLAQAVLMRESAQVKGVVDKMLGKLGQSPFTVDSSSSRTLCKVRLEAQGADYDSDNDFDHNGNYQTGHPEVRWELVAATGDEVIMPVRAAIEGSREVGLVSAACAIYIAAQHQAAVGDEISTNVTQSVSVLATTAEQALGVAGLMDVHLPKMVRRAGDPFYQDILLNGQPVVPAQDSTEAEPDRDVPR